MQLCRQLKSMLQDKEKVLVNYTSKFCSMNERDSQNYEAAVEALNSLQSNASYLKNVRSQATHGELRLNYVEKLNNFLNRSAITLEKLDELSVIHVTGTKGKGSTCAYCESILRHHGLKTGFFSSPHLVNVVERIKIDGQPIKKQLFTKHFWNVYNNLIRTKRDNPMMPIYFEMLTIVAFKAFLEEKVDVAVIEVGIGGEYDTTNILRNVPVVGITSVGFDHVSLLGNSLESIAWHKAGIMKNGCRAFTVVQKQEALDVLQKRSQEKQCCLEIVKGELNTEWRQYIKEPYLINADNVALAVSLTKAWLEKSDKNIQFNIDLAKAGIRNCYWPGRFQILHFRDVNFFLDGAHTDESIKICLDWFRDKVKDSPRKKVLVFNNTGDRNTENQFRILQEYYFHRIYFIPNSPGKIKTADIINYNTPEMDQMIKCAKNKNLWLELVRNREDCKSQETIVRPTFSDVLESITDFDGSDVLVTGSLHLVGAALSLIDPNYQEERQKHPNTKSEARI